MGEPNRVCVKCRATGHDSDSNHLFLMRDGITWTCRHVSYHEDGKIYYECGGEPVSRDSPEDMDGNRELLKFFIPKNSDDVTLPVSVSTDAGSVDVQYRGIRPDVFKRYETLCTKDMAGKILSLQHELKDTKGRRVVDKVRKLPKDFFTTGKTGGVPLQLFGQAQIPKAKRLLITEGELDAMSAYQMLEKYKVAVWSLPLGANKKCLLDNLDALNAYTKGRKELYFCMDSDEAGASVEKEIAGLFPTAKFLKLDRKDPNEYLLAHDESSFVSAFWDSEIYRPESVVRVSSLIADVMKEPVIGRPWPWPTLTAATYGRRGGEGIFVGGGVKSGKSEFINQVIAHDCERGWPIAAIKFEEQPAMTVKRVCGKLDGIMYHKPGAVYDKDKLRETALSLEPNLFLHQAFGQASWDTCKSYLRYAAGMGVQTIIIDPITKISNGMTPSETETELRRFSDELACMAMDLGLFYIVCCHLKAPSNGPLHERGGKVQSAQFRGSRAMMENTYYMLGIERNKDPELSEEERNTSTFVLLEDRAFGNVCSFQVYYDPTDQSYLERSLSSHF